MFRRPTSRPHARVFRSSASSYRTHQREGHFFAYIVALILLSTVAFLHAKSGSFQTGIHDPSDSVPLHRHSITEQPRRGAQELDRLASEALLKGVKVGQELPYSKFDDHYVKSFEKEAETFDSEASERNNVRESANLVLPQDDNDHTDDDEKLDEDTESDPELETDEMEDPENSRDIAEEALDDMDGDRGSEEEGADEIVVEVEQLKRQGLEQKDEDRETETNSDIQDSSHLPAVFTGRGRANTIQIPDLQNNSNQRLPERMVENQTHEGEAATGHTRNRGLQRGAHAANVQQRLGGVKGVPSWDPLENLGYVDLDKSSRQARRSFERRCGTNPSVRKDGLIWDHLLGVARRLRKENETYPAVGRKFKFGDGEINEVKFLSSTVKDRQVGFSNGSCSSCTQVFSSDDEPLDENVRESLEEVTAIEDALLLRPGKYDANKKDRSGKPSSDPLNPANNPLLQDPDTFGPHVLTKSDKAIWKAIRKASVEDTAFPREQTGDAGIDPTMNKQVVSSSESDQALPGQLVSAASTAERSILEVLTKRANFNSLLIWNASTENTTSQQQSKLATLVDSRTSTKLRDDFHAHTLSQEKDEDTLLMNILITPVNKSFDKEEANLVKSELNNYEKTEEHREQLATFNAIKYPEFQKPMEPQMDSKSMRAGEAVTQEEAESGKIEPVSTRHHLSGNRRQWGYFPGIDPFLPFSEFMEQFLFDSRCVIRVFMAWTTAPWAYTVRYQRGLESLLLLHPQACIVVFSESIELDFFESFVTDGFRVAVVLPNLEELLTGTPADVFASIWWTWRKIDLFHIHYTELLRLAALYKYGGLYLDTDVIILKPLNSLRSTVGAESMDNHMQRLNGAVMAFDRYSPFLLWCLEEFTETYNDRLLEFNGAELMTRVVKRIAGEQNKSWEQLSEILHIKRPQVFFPISSGNITRYFLAPVNARQMLEHNQTLKMILKQSLALHFWNQRTSRLVPEVGSLVERVINYRCLRCNEYL